ncbi:hypothetical protein GCM10022198_10590 [Klugiella xanthotipulae]|uniref:Uncharacterized protein DUF3592 n=1 Tax=Klugiella xanthotipulae TaxID=244735 RepID=A0A543HYN6_9MICO|nr:DUF3592 domain-containing protein [Klugiella xanthotipulae]TQM63457.1 uncharacterized protein DUF3592 [Klugiella xanthotipulae]
MKKFRVKKSPVKTLITFLFLSVVLLLVGVFAGYMSITDAVTYQSLDGKSESVTGTVTSTETDISHGRRGRTTTKYCPIYSYTTVDGERLSLTDDRDCQSSRSKVHEGATAPIVYDPNNPEVAFVNTQNTANKMTIAVVLSVSAFVGGLLLLVGSIIFFAVRGRGGSKTSAPAYQGGGYGQPGSQYGQQQQYGQAPQEQYGQTTPPYGQAQPQYGETPQYGQPQPQYGQTPPYGQPQQYGQSPQNAGLTPASNPMQPYPEQGQPYPPQPQPGSPAGDQNYPGQQYPGQPGQR